MSLPQPPKDDDILPAFCVAVLLVIVALCAVRNLPWNLDSLDQAKTAYTSFEIAHGGDLFFQHTPGGRVATKPPLAAWLSALLYFGMGGHGWEWAWRIPSFAAILGMLWFLWKGGMTLFGTNVGAVLAAGAFGLNSFTPRLATVVRTDAVLAAIVFALGYRIMVKVRNGDPWRRSEQWGTFGLVLAGLMIKGPILYAFLLPGLLAFWWLRRKEPDVGGAWAGWWPWLAPMAVFGLWAWIGMATVPHFREEVVGHEFLGRMTVGEKAVHNNMPPGFYTLNLLAKGLPWSLLLVAFSITVLRAPRPGKWSPGPLKTDPALLWLMCWTLGGLVFMELVPSKRFDRIFPAVAPACLLLAAMARHLPGFEWRGQPASRLAIFAALTGVLFASAYAGLRVMEAFEGDARALVRFGREVAEAVSDEHDRLAIVAAKDEGLLLYCDHPRFHARDDALAGWRFERIDWAVVSDRDLAKMRGELTPFQTVATIGKRAETESGYHLLKRIPRSKAAPPVPKAPPVQSAPPAREIGEPALQPPGALPPK